MIEKSKVEILNNACCQWSGNYPDNISMLPLSGSVREYYRIMLGNNHIIGVYSDNDAENHAFLYFTSHFRDKGLNVPEIYYHDLNKRVYLMEDLGDRVFYNEVIGINKIKPFPENVKNLYKKALEHLIRFQVNGFDGLDLSYCVPRQSFDKQSILWDLNYFKYYVLKLFNIPFNEHKLESEFNLLAEHLTAREDNYFLYRDFQSRNILIYKDDLYFIDYQGGRKGPPQYDLGSILFESKTNLPMDLREELLFHYLQQLVKIKNIDQPGFIERYYQFVFIRILQVLAAYGLRGYVENKALFLKSYPYAIRNLKWLMTEKRMAIPLPEIMSCIDKILQLRKLHEFPEESSSLQITINSFSYKKGIPHDMSGHGGGFVFDCRALPNPGRINEFKNLTGRDKKVKEFLGREQAVDDFLKNIFALVNQSVANYLARGFNHLMISLGCTGGQHRSVFCAEKLADYLRDEHRIEPLIIHRELS